MAGKTLLKQLAQSGATDGQIVRWNNTAGDWQPSTTTVSVLGRQLQESMIQSSPNQVINVYGNGSANARGLTFTSSNRNMLKLRVSFRVDSGNNHNLRVRLFKFDSGTVTQIQLATVTRSNTVNGNVTSGVYYVLEQLVSAGANPSESLIESGDAIYVTIDRSTGAVAQGVSQIVSVIESEVP